MMHDYRREVVRKKNLNVLSRTRRTEGNPKEAIQLCVSFKPALHA